MELRNPTSYIFYSLGASDRSAAIFLYVKSHEIKNPLRLLKKKAHNFTHFSIENQLLLCRRLTAKR